MKSLKKEIIKITKQLIRFKTIPQELGEIDKAMRYLTRELMGLEIKKFRKEKIISLAVSNKSLSNQEFDCILHGHIDVVPASDNQFQPKVVGGRIYGRGALDMKGGLAVLISLMKNLKKEKIHKKILLMITSDEEIGGENGTKYLLEKKGFWGNFFLTAEGEKKYWIKIEQKGVLMLKIQSYGKGGHAGYVWQGENAISKLYRVYQEIEKLFPQTRKDHWQTTINLGKIMGGQAVNSIPEYAEAEVDIRFCQNWTSADEILKAIRKKISKFSRVKLKVIYKTPLMKIDKNNVYLQKLFQIANNILYPQKVIFYKNPGTNDARFASAIRIPSTGFGPIDDNCHANKEWVDIKSLYDYYQILKQFLLSI